MNKITKRILIVIICLIAGWGIYELLSGNSDANVDNAGSFARRTSGESKPLNINGLIISEQSLSDDIYINGRLIPDEEVDLSFETSGKIVKIHFVEGTSVIKGQLLAKVNDEPLQAQLKKLEAQIQLAEDRVSRQSTLLEKDAVSKEALEQVKTELATLNADIELVKANIRQTELRAPFDGIIGLRQVSEGSYASPSTVIAKLTKLSPLKIEFSVNERYASDINKGVRLSFTVDGSNETYNASVYATEAQVDAETFSLKARALYPNIRHELSPGRFVRIQLKQKEILNAIIIPTEAIVPEMGVDKVFLYKNGKSQPVEVQKGLRTDANVQILNGLNIGDTLIISGTLQLRTGLPVTLDNIDSLQADNRLGKFINQ
ncbi:MAG: efflux RND transporter periplasmic adaptor subunit [Prevotellaceae bacterium]|jgi:membrane fusion protein (multidrug efflux system)|nr:efflux RND transporter periplasmic adaptor subunit [Prevotellaceae bacterium]